MSDIVGGLRVRLVRDSFHEMIRSSLSALGWFDFDRRHDPIRMLGRPLKWDEPVVPNLIAITVDDDDQEEAEMGNSSWTKLELLIKIEIYAQSESLGVQIASDVMGICNGQVPEIDRDRASFEIYDFRDTTPPVIGYAKIDDTERQRSSSRYERTWMRDWFIVTCTVTDYYGTDE